MFSVSYFCPCPNPKILQQLKLILCVSLCVCMRAHTRLCMCVHACIFVLLNVSMWTFMLGAVIFETALKTLILMFQPQKHPMTN
jgi:hypothetical protein